MRTSTIPASVNTASRIKSSQTKQLNLYSNTDRLAHITLPADVPRGTVIYDQVITPGVGKRLRQQAALFQKVKYVSLRFEIQTQTPTTNGGGYVVSFLHDPQMEVGSGENALRALTAVQGTQTSKFWQSTVYSVQTTSQQYFTLNGEDIRFFSPGRFLVLSDGPPTVPVSITILFHWTIELTRPALQRPLNQLQQVAVVASGLYWSGEWLRWTNWIGGKKFLPAIHYNTEDSTADNLRMEKAFSGLPPFENFSTGNILFYELPSPIPVPGSAKLARFIGFYKSDDETKLLGSLYQWPSKDWQLNSAEVSDTDPFWALIQHSRCTPVTADEFGGTVSEPFLASVYRSVSVNKQPTVYKTYSPVKLTESSTKSPTKESLLDRLSSAKGLTWGPLNTD